MTVGKTLFSVIFDDVRQKLGDWWWLFDGGGEAESCDICRLALVDDIKIKYLILHAPSIMLTGGE